MASISLGGNAADRVADVVEDVVARLHRLVDELEADLPRTPQKSTVAISAVDLDDLARNS